MSDHLEHEGRPFTLAPEAESPELSFMMRRLERNEFAQAQLFYKSLGQLTLIKPIDLVYGAFQMRKLVAVARLAPEYNSLSLRGFQVKPEFQKRGVGSRLLSFLYEDIKNRECFCLAGPELAEFFGKIGFDICARELAPAHLQRRLKELERELDREKGHAAAPMVVLRKLEHA